MLISFATAGPRPENWELAHFAARNVTSGVDGSNAPDAPMGFTRYSSYREGSNLVRYHHMHDVELRDINPRYRALHRLQHVVLDG